MRAPRWPGLLNAGGVGRADRGHRLLTVTLFAVQCTAPPGFRALGLAHGAEAIALILDSVRR
jgi:hypothetical protein